MALNFDPDFLLSSNLIHPDWLPALKGCREELFEIQNFLNQEIEVGKLILPAPENIFRALKLGPLQVRVVIVGQDPYPSPGKAMGLAFSVTSNVSPVPKSLKNIFNELTTDVNCQQTSNGDLTPWSDQGVLLLNRVLSVEAGLAGSHRGKGWEAVTKQLMLHLAGLQGEKLVAILWGQDAQTAKAFLRKAFILESVHPSPLSAHRGFFGSRPFSRANAYLREQRLPEIHWCLPGHPNLF